MSEKRRASSDAGSSQLVVKRPNLGSGALTRANATSSLVQAVCLFQKCER